MKRKILLVSTGLSPQVVTETLWALACRESPPWVPDRLHILTTADGAKRAQAALLDSEEGKITALARDYGQPALTRLVETCRIHTISADGEAFRDVDVPDAHAATANLAMRLIRDLTRDASSALHVSLAGGRKSMGVLLAQALSLFGRPQDRLSNMLVHEGFISHPDFFYPPREPKKMHDRNNRLVDSRVANLRMVEIPFVRLRPSLPERAFELPGLSEVMAAAQKRMEPPNCVIDLTKRTLQIGGHRISVPPLLLAWTAALAEAPDGLRRSSAPRAPVVDNYRPKRKAELNWSDPLDPGQVQEWTSRLNKLVGRDFPGILDDFFITRHERRPDTVYRLSLPRNKVRIIR